MLVLFAGIALSSWALHQIFTGRAAQLHLGAMTATIMTANVFFVIMPNQRIVMGDLQAGRARDARYGAIAKLRSTHTNYLIPSVIFLMLSNRYPTAFAVPGTWPMGPMVFLIGIPAADVRCERGRGSLRGGRACVIGTPRRRSRRSSGRSRR